MKRRHVSNVYAMVSALSASAKPLTPRMRTAREVSGQYEHSDHDDSLS
jgi:hypothetical protein